MKTTKIDAIAAVTKKLLANRKAEIADLKEQIIEVDAAIKAARLTVDEARSSGNVEEYMEAMRKQRDLQDVREMYTQRIEDITQKPLISKEDYTKAVSDIFAEFHALEDQTAQRIRKLSIEMHEAGDDLAGVINYANKVLHCLQHDIYMDADRRRSKTGALVINDEKAINEWDTVSWCNAGINHYRYKDYEQK